MKDIIRNFLRDEEGQDLVEYTLLLAFVALAAAGIMTGLSGSIKGIFTEVNTQLGTANTAATPAAS